MVRGGVVAPVVAGASTLWPVAVGSLGRRAADAPVVDAALVEGIDADGVVIALDHAGPQAAAWSQERALGPTDEPEPRSGRRPLPLDDDGWRAIEEQYAAAARLCHARGVRTVLAVDDDGLLHCTLRAAAAAGARNRADDFARTALGRVLAIHRAVGGGDVLLAVEDLAPQGLDATDGIAHARAFVAQGAKRIYATAGTCALPALRRREGGAAHMRASAQWLCGRVAAEIVALLPDVGHAAAAPPGVVVERGVRL